MRPAPLVAGPPPERCSRLQLTRRDTPVLIMSNAVDILLTDKTSRIGRGRLPRMEIPALGGETGRSSVARLADFVFREDNKSRRVEAPGPQGKSRLTYS